MVGATVQAGRWRGDRRGRTNGPLQNGTSIAGRVLDGVARLATWQQLGAFGLAIWILLPPGSKRRLATLWMFLCNMTREQSNVVERADIATGPVVQLQL
jgi:hypothetical protein